jgi:hypothetical protein
VLDAQTTSSQLSAYMYLKSPHRLKLQNTNSQKIVVRDINCAQTMSYFAGCSVELFTASSRPGKNHLVTVNGIPHSCAGAQPDTHALPWIVAGSAYTIRVFEVTSCSDSTSQLTPLAESTVAAIY